jgi:xanthine dehydrogenase small subunit
VRRSDELIRAVRIPLPLSSITGFHKISKRRFDDISSVAVGFALDVEDGVVRTARIGLGGIAATPLRAYATEQSLLGRPWTAATIARRPTSWAPRARRWTTTEPAPPTGRRCCVRRC